MAGEELFSLRMFLDRVKFTCGDKSREYNDLMNIDKDYRWDFASQLIDAPEIIARVSNVFQDRHPELIMDFKRLFKKKAENTYTDEVRKRFGDQSQVFRDFENIFQLYKANNTNIQVLIGRIVRLFSGDPDLINGFNIFLPPGVEMPNVI